MSVPVTEVTRRLNAKKREEERKRKESRKRNSGMNVHKAVGKCGAKKSDGKLCQQPAGFGTDHYGIGKCKWHGGTTPSHVMSAAKEEYRMLLGKPVDTNPYDAIMNCIRIRAGEVAWLSERMAELDEKAWVESTLVGKQFHLYAKERQAGMDALVRYSQIAISLNISERAVKLAEAYAETIAVLLRGVMDQIMPYLSPEGQQRIPQIVRRQLLQLEGVEVPIGDEDVIEVEAEVVR